MKKHETTRIERLEDLIRSKAFHELSPHEKNFVLEEFESEEEYVAMQKLSPTLIKIALNNSEIQPKPSTLEFLKQNLPAEASSDLFWNRLFEWKVPAYATVLMTAMSCLITWWIAIRPVKEISVLRSITKIDTVYLTSEPDTIFKEKIVYRFVNPVEGTKLPTELKGDITTKKNELLKELPVGVSMRDKEELEKLLVSGSR